MADTEHKSTATRGFKRAGMIWMAAVCGIAACALVGCATGNDGASGSPAVENPRGERMRGSEAGRTPPPASPGSPVR